MLQLTDFLAAVGSLKFRGTSVLFRLPRSALSHLLTRSATKSFACTSYYAVADGKANTRVDFLQRESLSGSAFKVDAFWA